MPKRPRILAFYLPQYHPIRENDDAWGKGFTEWMNVVRARPLYKGHRQPDLPAELGFYDLRLPDVRLAQASMAKEAGVDGFVYYHYWFSGRRLLGRPLDDVLSTGEPDFPFALCWANENWTRVWDGGGSEVIVRQGYSAQDDLAHIEWLSNVFRDPRYIRIEGKPLFLVYRASQLPNPRATTDRWRSKARDLGVGELYLCRVESFHDRGDPRPLGFDASVDFQPQYDSLPHGKMTNRIFVGMVKHGLLPGRMAHHRVEYSRTVDAMCGRERPDYPWHACVTPSWDNTARRANKGLILVGSNPAEYGRWLSFELHAALHTNTTWQPLVFINAWNEWAEGCHLEPDQAFGDGWLKATAQAVRAAGI